jgi:gamma-glutamyl phosphate reductase
MDTDQISTLIEDIAQRARAASLDLATLSTEAKNRFLELLAQ